MSKEVRKVKHTSTGVLITLVAEKALSEDNISRLEMDVKCKDTPHPDFANALQAFEDIVRFDGVSPKGHKFTEWFIDLDSIDDLKDLATRAKKDLIVSFNQPYGVDKITIYDDYCE